MGDLLDRQTFCRVVELSSFAATARDMGLPTASVSASVRRLEEALGVRLLERTTRKVSVTEAGQAYYDSVLPALDDLKEAESTIAEESRSIRGKVRIAAPTHLAEALLVPKLPEFVECYPEIALDFALADQAVDLVEQNIDISVRIGPLQNTAMTALKLGTFHQILCATPDWIEAHGHVNDPDEIPEKLRLAYRFPGATYGYPWVFKKGDSVVERRPEGSATFDDLDAYIAAGCTGLEMICALSFQVEQYREREELVSMLPGWTGAGVDVHALTPERRLRTKRVQCSLDWLKRCVGR